LFKVHNDWCCDGKGTETASVAKTDSIHTVTASVAAPNVDECRR